MRKSISSAGHVPLVLERVGPESLDAEGRVHDADLGNVEQRDRTLEVLAEQLRPALDGPAGVVGVVSERVGVVPARHHGDVARRSVDVLAVRVDPQMAERRVALSRFGFGREPSGLGQIGDLVPVADALGVDGLPYPGRPHHVHVVVVALRDLVLIVLVQHLAEHPAVAERLASDGEPQVHGCLRLDFVDDAHPQTDGPDGVGRTHDRGKCGDRGARRRCLGGGSQELAPGDSFGLRSAGFILMLGLHKSRSSPMRTAVRRLCSTGCTARVADVEPTVSVEWSGNLSATSRDMELRPEGRNRRQNDRSSRAGYKQ